MLVKVESALPLIFLDSSSPRLFLKWLIPDRLMSLQNLSKARCMSVLQRDTARTGRYPQQESANTHSAILAKRDAGDDAQGNREDQCGSGTTSGREITPLAAKGRFNMKEPGLDNRHRDKAKPKAGETHRTRRYAASASFSIGTYRRSRSASKPMNPPSTASARSFCATRSSM